MLLTEAEVRKAARRTTDSLRKSATMIEATRQDGLCIYWIVDPELDRNSVRPATAQRLRGRMSQSDAMSYLHSAQSTRRWMPWELGYFDGHSGNVAIIPVIANEEDTFRGSEYLGLYPVVD
jgi:hypothetical protein